MLCIQVEAQVFYSTDKNYFRSKTEQNNLVSVFNYNYPDSAINELSQFAPRNFLGNTGLPSPAYILNYNSEDLGFRLFNIPYANDRILESQVQYFRTKGPYAQLTGISGDKKLQIFRMLFTHSFKERLNFTLRFNRYTSQGFYLQQQTFTDNFYLSSNYNSLNNKWGYYFFVLNNGNKNEENGGIKDVVLNDSTVSINKDLFRINLDSSSRENRELKLMLNPWLRIFGGRDSVLKTRHYLQLKSGFTSASLKYKSGDRYAGKFYANYYYDSINAKDSSHLRQFSNELNYTIKHPNEKFAVSLGYRHELNQVWQKGDSLIQHQIIKGDLFFTQRKANKADTSSERNFTNQLNFQYIVAGPNSGNYLAENKFLYILNETKKSAFFFNIKTESRSPDFIYNNWNSNHFRWFNNGYKAEQKTELKTGYGFNKQIELSLFYQNIFNLLYFDQYALPRQYDRTVENIGLTASLSKVFFKHLGVFVSHTFQQSSRSAYFRLPPNVTTARLFYNGNLFKNNLQLQLGSQVQVYQSFLAYNYMPATQVFYLQERATTAALPFLDVYLHARIRPVTIFIKLENSLQALVGNNYSFVPGYFQTDRALRFGITWVFFD